MQGKRGMGWTHLWESILDFHCTDKQVQLLGIANGGNILVCSSLSKTLKPWKIYSLKMHAIHRKFYTACLLTTNLSFRKQMVKELNQCVWEKCLYNSSLADWLFTSPLHRQSRNDAEVWLHNEKLSSLLASAIVTLSMNDWNPFLHVWLTQEKSEWGKEEEKDLSVSSDCILQMRNVELPLSVSLCAGQRSDLL